MQLHRIDWIAPLFAKIVCSRIFGKGQASNEENLLEVSRPCQIAVISISREAPKLKLRSPDFETLFL